MAAGPELSDFNSNLSGTQARVEEVRGLVQEGVDKAQQVEDALNIFDDIASNADFVASVISGIKVVVQLLGKVGPLKSVSVLLKNVLDDMSDAVKAVANKARDIDQKLEPSKEKVRDAREELEGIEEDLGNASDELETYQTAGLAVENTLDVLDGLQVADDLSDDVDNIVETPNDAVSSVNEAYDDAVDALNGVGGLLNSIRLPALNLAINIQNDLNKITGDLAFLKKPLEAVNVVLQPVKWALDAVDFVFDKVVSPVLNPVLDALGVTKVMDKISDSLKKLLPDVGDLTSAEDALEDAIDALTPNVGLSLGLGIDEFLNGDALGVPETFGVFDFLDDALSDPQLILGTDGNDGALAGDGDNNIISGGDGDDTLLAAGGLDTLTASNIFGSATEEDILVGGAGNDLLFGTNNGITRAVFSGNISEYQITFEEGTGRTFVTHVKPANSSENDGRDTAINVDFYHFNGVEFSESLLRNGLKVSDGSGGAANPLVLVGEDDANADQRDYLIAAGNVSMVLLGGAGADNLVGDLGDETMLGGEGDDNFDAGEGKNDLIGGDGFDTASYKSRAAGVQVDLGFHKGERKTFLFSPSDTLIQIERVEGSLHADQLFGSHNGTDLEALSGNSGSDLLNGFEGWDLLDGEDGNDLIIGGTGTDTALGGDGLDILVAGQGRNDFYDGGQGFDLLTYDCIPDRNGSTDLNTLGTKSYEGFVFANPGDNETGWAVGTYTVADGFAPSDDTGTADGFRRDFPVTMTAHDVIRGSEELTGDRSAFLDGELRLQLRYLGTESASGLPDVRVVLESVTEAGDPIFIAVTAENITSNPSSRIFDLAASEDWQVVDASVLENDAFKAGDQATADQIAAVVGDIRNFWLVSTQIAGVLSVGTITFSSPEAGTDLEGHLDFALTDLDIEPVGQSLEVDFADGEVDRFKTSNGKLTNTDRFQNIEAFVGSNFDDTYHIDLADKVDFVRVEGRDGDDLFNIGQGIITAYGEGGDDTFVVNEVTSYGGNLVGGVGVDLLDLSNLNDDFGWFIAGGTLQQVGEGSDLSILQNSGNLTLFGPEFAINGFESVIGTNASDRISGSQSINAGGGDDVVLVTSSPVEAGATYRGGSGDDELVIFNSSDAKVRGGSGNDVFSVIGGSSSQFGHSVFGDAGDDYIIVAGGWMSINGGSGIDTMSFGSEGFTGGLQPVTVDLGLNVFLGAAVGLQVSGIENLVGSRGGDDLTGDNGVNLIIGNDGNDNISGGGSTDTEELAETAGDQLFGNEGEDTLKGDAGDDLLHGGADDDTLIGGDGTDTGSWVFFEEVPFGSNSVNNTVIGQVDADLSRPVPSAFFRKVYADDDYAVDITGWVGSGPSAPSNPTQVHGTNGRTALLVEASTFPGSQRSVTKTFDLVGEVFGESPDGPIEIVIDYALLDGEWSSSNSHGLKINGVEVLEVFGTAKVTTPANLSGLFGTYTVDIRPFTSDFLGDRDGDGQSDDRGRQIVVTLTNPTDDLEIEIFSMGNFAARAKPIRIEDLRITEVTPETDEMASIENLVGGAQDDRLVGDEGENVLSGGNGDDFLNGNGGDDILIDGEGYDVMYGGLGSDRFLMGAGARDGQFGDVVFADVGNVNGAGVDFDVVDYSGLSFGVTVEQVADGQFSALKTYTVGFARWEDTQTTEERSSGSLFATPWAVLQGNDATYTDSIDDLQFAGVEDVLGRVEVFSQELTVRDELIEVESVVGTLLDDTFIASSFVDNYDAGDGAADMLDFRNSTVAVEVSLETGTFSGGDAAGGTYTNFEALTGSDLDDTLEGDGGANILIGGAGNDSLKGRVGADHIEAGAGNDIIVGGLGTDVFVYAVADDEDTITDFRDDKDTLDLIDFGFATVADATALATEVGSDVLFDFGGGDTLLVKKITLAQIEDDIQVVPLV
ncbi:MAG: hypothetical protein AAGF71_03075 [Pseudomonadota bacterium]